MHVIQYVEFYRLVIACGFLMNDYQQCKAVSSFNIFINPVKYCMTKFISKKITIITHTKDNVTVIKCKRISSLCMSV